MLVSQKTAKWAADEFINYFSNFQDIEDYLRFVKKEVLSSRTSLVSLSDELISVSGNPISFAKKNIFKGLSDEIKIDLKRKLLYLSGTSSIFIDGKNISGEDIVFDYKNNSILNSENLRIKSENS